MIISSTHAVHVELTEAERFRVRVAPPDHFTGVVEVVRARAHWTRENRRPTLTLFGYWVRIDGHAGRVRTSQTVLTWRRDGRRVVAQLPAAFLDVLEAEGMELRGV